LKEVADGTFSERRYALSPQLKKMGELNRLEGHEKEWAELLTKWKAPSKKNVDEFLEPQAEASAVPTIHGRDFFTTKRASTW